MGVVETSDAFKEISRARCPATKMWDTFSSSRSQGEDTPSKPLSLFFIRLEQKGLLAHGIDNADGKSSTAEERIGTDMVFAHQMPECPPILAAGHGRGGDVAVMFGQEGLKIRPLKFGDHLRFRGLEATTFFNAKRQLNVLRLEDASRTEDNTALDHVFQFTDIAGPIVEF